MRRLLVHSWVQVLIWTALVLLARELFAPGTASASCGEHVRSGQPGHSPSNVRQTGAPEQTPPEHDSAPPRKKRGHCPLCDGAPAPQPTPPVTPPLRIHDFASLINALLTMEGNPVPLWALHERHARIHRAVFIFHPPRLH